MRLTEYIQRLHRILGEEGDLAVIVPNGMVTTSSNTDRDDTFRAVIVE